jgi:hypothetical protein
MKDKERQNEAAIQPTIQLKHLPLLLRPKQLCELFGINLKTLHRLETSGRVKAVRIGPRQVQRRYSPVAVAKSLGVDLMAENYTLLAGTSFTKDLGDRLADSSAGVLTKTRELIQTELHGLHQSIGQLVSSELAKALQGGVVSPRPAPQPPPPQDPKHHRLRGYVPPQKQAGY